MSNNVELYISNISNMQALNESYCQAHFPLRYIRAQRYKFKEDKLRCLAAGYLMSEVLHIFEEEIEFSELGKPFVKGKPGFNISHSGAYAVLAVADGMVGVDVEKIERKHLEVSSRVLTSEELEWMKENAERRFFILWTLKEAVSKAVGKGITLDYRKLNVMPLLKGEAVCLDGTVLYAKTRFIDDYVLSVAAEGIMNDCPLKIVK